VCEISSLCAAGKFTHIVRLRKGEKSFKTNLCQTSTTYCEPRTALVMKQPPAPPPPPPEEAESELALVETLGPD